MKNNRKLTSPQSLNSYPSTIFRTGIKSICDIMRRSGRAGALQYVPELTWMLFLRSDFNVTKKQPLTIQHFDEFFKLFNPSTLKLSESECSWCVPIEDIEAKNYDIKAVNPNRKDEGDKRTPRELLDIIESQTKEIQNTLITLRNKYLP